MQSSSWPPAATPALLRARAELYERLRIFFRQRGVLEVEVPLLARHTATDPHIDSIAVTLDGADGYLQTSPEFFMKRLLAAGVGDIYSLGKAFRRGEAGRRHNPEFTMLEWYRLDLDEQQLMDEVEALLGDCLKLESIRRVSYRELFETQLGIDPHRASAEQLRALAAEHVDVAWQEADVDTWLDVLMTHVIEPALGRGLVFVYDYPASQAALARVATDAQGQRVARRFEAYVNGMELANGYWELTDAVEQRRRFAADSARRQQLGLPELAADEHLLAALASGLPACAGVALGVDRLLMQQAGAAEIAAVLAFPVGRV
ncbi:MAG: EF-P lysine aminoacylase GenX [Gammaproteobacteria bacterium]|nr:EF-P lysine aminoacylase GenX [Gammaproteobacteria bacterium]